MKTRDKILQKALELFNQNGFHEVGVRQIARALKISPGNLSYHFSKKEDVFFELLKQFSEKNDLYYEDFYSTESTLANFLILIRNILKSQYKHRGILLATSFVTDEIKNQDRLNYKETTRRRKQGVRRIFDKLVLNKQLKASTSDVDFLVSFLSLFGRFSIQEAFFEQKERDEKEVISHYMKMLSKQMSLFATARGKASLKKFHLTYLN